MKNRILLIASSLLIVQNGFAQQFDKDKLDRYFQALEEHNKFMGSVALAQNGKLIYTKSVGYADAEAKIKNTELTKFRIGSISKTFTSVLVFKAVEEKKLTLETTLDKFYPTVKNASKITIEHLLTHRSGIHNFTEDKDYPNWSKEAKTEREMLQTIERSGSDFEPNAKAQYSNSNYILLSYILQKLYKKPYAALLNKKIVKPLGLKNTYVGGKINIRNNESRSYRFLSSWEKEPETDMSVPTGAGAVVSNPTDLVLFAEALFSGKIISEKSLETMKTLRDNYGYGLYVFPFYDKKSYGHTGGIDGFSSVFGYFPDEKLCFARMSNGSNYTDNNISVALLSAFYGKPYEIPDFKTVEIADEILETYAGMYSSESFPLKITVSKKDKALTAQATGQSSFPLEATEVNIFKFEPAGVVIEFIPEEKVMILRQAGREFKLSKEE